MDKFINLANNLSAFILKNHEDIKRIPNEIYDAMCIDFLRDERYEDMIIMKNLENLVVDVTVKVTNR